MSAVFQSCSALRLSRCSIDTPGVIQRVSRLFHGNPNLIQGFNTFLPLGYRIDISSDPLDPNTITVTTPSGTTTQSINNAYGRPLPLGYGAPMGSGTLSRSMTPHALHLHSASPFDPSGFSSTQTTAAASFLGNLNGRDPVGKQAAGEFNHAIQYLNKIKARYVDDNNTYKQFLDILQTYQKEQKDIQDVSIIVTCPSIIVTSRQVYLQVNLLFRDAPELLAEFKDFLPEAASAIPGQTGVVILPQSHLGAASGWSQQDVSIPSSSLSKKPLAATKRRKRPAEKDTTPAPSDKLTQNRVRPAHHHVLLMLNICRTNGSSINKSPSQIHRPSPRLPRSRRQWRPTRHLWFARTQ